MNYQKLLAILVALEFIIIIIGKFLGILQLSNGLAFGLGIALKAKEASLWSQLDSIDPTLAPYDNVPSFVNFFLFTTAFGFVSLLALMIVTLLSEIIYTSVWLMIHFINWLFFLTSYSPLERKADDRFIFFEMSDIGSKATCDAVSGTILDSAFCKLPRACEGISVVAWVLLMFGLAGRWWAARHHASGKDARLALYPAMTERKTKTGDKAPEAV